MWLFLTNTFSDETLKEISTVPDQNFAISLYLKFFLAYIVFSMIVSVVAYWHLFINRNDKPWKTFIPIYRDFVAYKWFSKIWLFILLIVFIIIFLMSSARAMYILHVFANSGMNVAKEVLYESFGWFIVMYISAVMAIIINVVYSIMLGLKYKYKNGIIFTIMMVAGMVVIKPVFLILLVYLIKKSEAVYVTKLPNKKIDNLKINKETIDEQIDKVSDVVKSEVESVHTKIGESVGVVADKLEDAKVQVGGAVDIINDKIEDLKEQTKDVVDIANNKIEDLKEQAMDVVDIAKDKIDDLKILASDVSDIAKDKFENVEEQVENVIGVMAEKYEDVKEQVDNIVEIGKSKLDEVKMQVGDIVEKIDSEKNDDISSDSESIANNNTENNDNDNKNNDKENGEIKLD